ncbi:MAG: glycosyltransferase [Desulfarculaceae bacterium]|nr:glycosyltransferase [Desulfarculaceae bacterium]
MSEAEVGRRVARNLRRRGVGAALHPSGHVRSIYASELGEWEKHQIPAALAGLGEVEVFALPEHGFDPKAEDWLQRRQEMEAKLLAFVAETHARKPVDVLVSYLSGYHVSPETVERIKGMGIATCAFHWDDRLYFRGRLGGGRYTGPSALARAYDLNLTNASRSLIKYFVEGGLAIFWPEGADPDHFAPRKVSLEFDVSFIGANYGQRPEWIRYLRRHGVRVAAFGPGWEHGPVPSGQMPEIYSQSRINLGFSGIGYSMRETCLKGRDFEVPMCGAAYLTSEQEDLHRVYEVGREVASYKDKQDCLAVIKRLLADPGHLERMGLAARQRCLAQHTWAQRFAHAFGVMGIMPPGEPEQASWF